MDYIKDFAVMNKKLLQIKFMKENLKKIATKQLKNEKDKTISERLKENFMLKVKFTAVEIETEKKIKANTSKLLAKRLPDYMQTMNEIDDILDKRKRG